MQNLSDRELKERVVGAVVLVVLAVLVVPIFLDGPSDAEDTITEPVTLPGQNDQQRKQQTIVLDRDRSEPVPTTPAPAPAQSSPVPVTSNDLTVVESAVDETPEPAMEEPVPEGDTVAEDQKPAEQNVPVVESSATGMWAVQLGSFSSQENAERLASGLREQGYAAFLSQLQTASGQLHRVRIGPQKDRDSAEKTASQLSKNGHKGQVVPHP